LLVVLGIVGILAAIALPNVKNFTPNIGATAGRQLLADVNHARQLAIGQHTTVYMVFVPPNLTIDPLNFTSSPGASSPLWNNLPQGEKPKATNVLQMQLAGYNYVVLRSLGDQPGNPTPRYLGAWKSLPDGAYIAPSKFSIRPAYAPQPPPLGPLTDFSRLVLTNNNATYLLTNCIPSFRTNNTIPFPSEYNLYGRTNGYITLPYIAFNYLGQLVDASGNLTKTNEFIPLVKGNISYNHDANGRFITGSPPTPPTTSEKPSGNWTNAYNVVEIDWLTGRARLQTPPVQ
jgi:type II secretory pathway pseudopilin PulG